MATLIVGLVSTNELLQLQTYVVPYSDPNVIGLNYPQRNGYDLNDVVCSLIDQDYTPWEFAKIYYMNAGVPILRPTMECSVDKTIVIPDGIDYCTIYSVPVGAEIFINNSVVGIADGTNIKLTFNLGNSYHVCIKLTPYLDWTVVINAN